MTGNVHPPENLAIRLARQKARLQSLRDQARERFSEGTTSLQVAALISERTDRLIVELLEEILAPPNSATQQSIAAGGALLAVGGSGRGELCPFSDADLLFIHTPAAARDFFPVVTQLVRDCWDAGITLGHSVRTLSDTISMAIRDPHFASSLVEARLLWGSDRLFAAFQRRFQRRVIRWRRISFYEGCVAAREVERAQHGLNVGQLEPDVKRASGGLRDIHLIRWLGYAKFGTTDLDFLWRRGALSREDLDRLVEGHEFLTRIRVDLHFAAGKAQEVLNRQEQLRLAELLGYADTAGQRGVEQFMRDYFRHTTAVADVAARFTARHRPRSLLSRAVQFILTHRNEGVFRVGPDEIDVVPTAHGRVCGSLEQLLELFQLAGLYGLPLAPDLHEAVRRAAPGLPEQLSPQAAETFLSILSRRGRLGAVLRDLYQAGILEKIIPQFQHARCLLQFNLYHQHTVDEHTLRALEIAEGYEHDSGPIGRAYREIRDKRLLHLALLLHDLGKGFVEDHSDVGKRIAEETAERLRLSGRQRELLVFLVHKHLYMAHLAFRRDLSDRSLVLQFTREVGSQECLRMMFVLTAADVSAVGPGTWTDWKAELLTELYNRSMQALGSEEEPLPGSSELDRVIPAVRAHLAKQASSSPDTLPYDLAEELEGFPAHYLTSTPPEQIAVDLEQVRRLASQPVFVGGRFDVSTGTVEYRIVTSETAGSGLFSRIAGALTAKGLEILSAQICTTTIGAVVDSFRVLDRDYSGASPDFRLREVETAIRDVLTGTRTVESLFRRHTRFSGRALAPLPHEPTRVVIDNTSSERFTIIDVFTQDRPGLLYTIAASLLELQLSVGLAKISTHLDQVLDVFYVTQNGGQKLEDNDRLTQVQQVLQQRIEEFEQQGLAAALQQAADASRI